MRCGHDDLVFLGHLLVALDHIEGNAAIVHGRHEHVGSQSQQELEDALVCAGTYLAFVRLRFVGFPAPRVQSVIFIVDKDAPVLHRRFLSVAVAGR